MIGVGYEIRDRQLFSDVHLQVSSGESVAIVGPSGVGKSSLLAIIGGLLQPTTGNVEFRDAKMNLHAPSAVAQRCAWVLQFASVFPNRTTADNTSVPLILAGVRLDEARQRVKDALSLVELAERSDSRARHLSGGELQRLSIARAIAARQPLVLADEPTPQLDERLSMLAVRRLLVCCRESILVIVTHDRDIARLCDRCYRLSGSGLARVDTDRPNAADCDALGDESARPAIGVFDVRPQQ